MLINLLLIFLGLICVVGLVAVAVIAVQIFVFQHQREHRLQHPRP